MSRSRIARPALAAVAVAGLVGALSGTPAVRRRRSAGRGLRGQPGAVQREPEPGRRQGLRDRGARVGVQASSPLTNLDGSGYLRGDWANVVTQTGKPVSAKTGYVFNRHEDGFEQVMAYYWVTQAQRYLQSLGFGAGGANGLRPVNKESQDVRINQYGADNSFSWDKHDLLRFGKGGVDDAEDAEVIVHEYGHAVHDAQVPGYGTSLDAGSIGEAFGDYLAVSVGLWAAGQNSWPVKAPAACVMDWDATSYTSTVPHCLRRVDTNLTVAQRRNQVHFDGQIWSRALWDIRNGIDATPQGTVRDADRIIIEAQFAFDPGTSFAAAAQDTLDAAHKLYGSPVRRRHHQGVQGPRHPLTRPAAGAPAGRRSRVRAPSVEADQVAVQVDRVANSRVPKSDVSTPARDMGAARPAPASPEQRVDVGDLDPAARCAGEERLGTGPDRPLQRVAVPPFLVRGLPQVHDSVVPAQHGEAAVVVQHLEAEPVAVEGDSSGGVAYGEGRDRAAERHRWPLVPMDRAGHVSFSA